MAPRLSKTAAKERAPQSDPGVVKSYKDKIVRTLEKKNQIQADLKGIYDAADGQGLNRKALKDATALSGKDPLVAQSYLRAFTHYCGVLGITSQGDMLASENALTPTDAPEGDEANKIAFDQGRQVGLAGGDLLSNPYADNNPARPFWASGWRQGQTDIATGLTPKGSPPIQMPVEELAMSAGERKALEGDGDADAETAPITPAARPRRGPVGRARKASDGVSTVQ